MALDLFATRTMLPAVEQMLPAKKFLQTKFFKNVRTVETEHVDIDIYRGKRRTAAYVSPKEEGEVVSRVGYTTYSYRPPYIKQKMATIAGDMLKRSYGESIYAAETPLQRAIRQVALDFAELDGMITRAEELQACEGLFTGKVTLLDGAQIDFGQLGTHQISSMSHLWTDKTLGTPLDDLRAWRQLVIKDSGLAPDTVVMGTDALNAFINHPQISNNTGSLSMVKIDRGQIKPELLAEGVIYWGYISEIGCDIYSYDEWYVPADGSAAVPMVPANKVMIGSSQARMDTIYGPIQDMEALYAVRRFPKSWIDEDPSVRWLMLQSSPLLVPAQVDAYLWAIVCA